MMSNVVIRDLTEDDIQTVTDIEKQLTPSAWTYKNFSDCLVAGYPAWVLCLDSSVVGYTVVQKIVDELHLLNIGIETTFQGRGYGNKLLSHVMNFAEEESCKTILLEVRASNHRAQNLYMRNGFNEMSLRRDYYPAEQGREDAVLMAKELDIFAFFGHH